MKSLLVKEETMKPDKYIDNVYNEEETSVFQELYRQGYRGIMFDIDNTLAADNSPADSRAKQSSQDWV